MKGTWLALLVSVLLFAFIDPFGIFSAFFTSAESNPDTARLPYFVFRTLIRMTATYILVATFALVYGITAGLHRKAANIMIPIIDVLQDVPVLGFLPAAVIFFVNKFQGTLGLEFASMFLIFTGMAWAPTLGVYGAVRNIPDDISNTTRSYGVRGWKYIKNVVLPAIFPNFITHSMLAWGGGWYFLIAAEYISYGTQKFVLPGIGYYMANAVFNLGNMSSAILGLVILVAIVASINLFVWRPLIDYSQKFKYEFISSESIVRKEARLTKLLSNYVGTEKGSITSIVDKVDNALGLIITKRFKKSPYIFHAIARSRTHIHYNPRLHAIRTRTAANYKLIGYMIGILVVIGTFIFFLGSPPESLTHVLQKYPEAYNLPKYVVFSLLRIIAAFTIALVWTTAAGLIITRNKKLYSVFMPLFDIAQSVPALALFPFIVVILIKSFGTGDFVSELATILLILTGAQWYMLFNIVGHLQAVPHDVRQFTSAYGIKGWKELWNVTLPAIFPGIIIGGIQAFGGAWNALIVSEYILYGGQRYSVAGVGYFLDKAAWELGDTTLVIITVMTMVAAILILNRFVWKPLFDRAERYRFEVY
ncbi:MAG: ABC transporter permease subunit [Candidatus Aenigmatarchaeota archaeon]